MYQLAVAIVIALFTTFAWAEKALAPDGAIFPREHVHVEYQPPATMAKKGFDHLVGWINVATVRPELKRGESALVEIRDFKIVEKQANGSARIEAEGFSRDGAGVTLEGGFWKRNNAEGKPWWFRSGRPEDESDIALVKDRLWSINLREAAPYVYHAWTVPRLPAVPGSTYLIEATIRVTGEAHIQFGIDYWKGSSSEYSGWSAGCVTSNNCEAWLSEWFGDTDGKFITVRVPWKLR